MSEKNLEKKKKKKKFYWSNIQVISRLLTL